MRILMLVGVVLCLSGCVVVPARRGPPPPPQRGPMTYNEAVNLGFQFCHSRGYQCQLKDARMAGNSVWKLKFNAIAPGARGHVSLAYNAYTRELLKVNEKVKARGGGWDDDDGDDDDRGHGHGR